MRSVDWRHYLPCWEARNLSIAWKAMGGRVRTVVNLHTSRKHLTHGKSPVEAIDMDGILVPVEWKDAQQFLGERTKLVEDVYTTSGMKLCKGRKVRVAQLVMEKGEVFYFIMTKWGFGTLVRRESLGL